MYSYIMKYYSTIKRNEILSFAKTWMDIEDITLTEISQMEKDKYCMILVCKKSQIYQNSLKTSVYLQNKKLKYRNLLDFYTSKLRKQKEKLSKQSHSPVQ